MDFQPFANHLAIIAQDRALCASFRAQHADLVASMQAILADIAPQNLPPKPLPALDDVTALIATVFDNWPNGRQAKNYPHRYKVALEAWTVPSREIKFEKGKWQFKGHAEFMTANELVKKAADLQSNALKNPISADYADMLIMLAEAMPDDLFGPIYTKGFGEHGTLYHESQVVRAQFTNGKLKGLDIITGDDVMMLTKFSPLDCDKNELKGKAFLQCRVTPCPRLSRDWATENL